MTQKTITTIVLILSQILTFSAQSLPGFRYQAIARDAAGAVIKSQQIGLRFSIIEVTQNEVKYSEVHNVNTSSDGVFALTIGEGNLLGGDFESIAWNNDILRLLTEIDLNADGNYTSMGMTDFNAVPYAAHAQTVADKNDADADPQNEIQMLTFDTGTNVLSISGGNSISIPTGGSDADADPTNEYQDLNVNQIDVVVELGISDGKGVTFSVVDGDGDGGNELQQLSLQGTFLGLSDGNEVDLAEFSSPWKVVDDGIEYKEGKVYAEKVEIDTSILIETDFPNSEFTMPSNRIDAYGMWLWDRSDPTITTSYGVFESNYRGLDFKNNFRETFYNAFGVYMLAVDDPENSPLIEVDFSVDSLSFKRRQVGLLPGRASRLTFDDLTFDNGFTQGFYNAFGMSLFLDPTVMHLDANRMEMREESDQGGQNSFMTLSRDSVGFYNQFGLLLPATSGLTSSALNFENSEFSSRISPFSSEFDNTLYRSFRNSNEYIISEIRFVNQQIDRFKLKEDNMIFFGGTGSKTAHLGSLNNSIAGFLELYDGTGFRTMTLGSSLLNNSEGTLILFSENDPIMEFSVNNGAALMNTYNVNSAFTMHDNIGTKANQMKVNDVGLGEIWSNYHIYVTDEITGFAQGGIMSDQVYTYGQFNLYEFDSFAGATHFRGKINTELNAGNMELYGPNGFRNTFVSYINDGNDGYIAVCDKDGIVKANMFSDSDGLGKIFTDELTATTINMFIDHPTKSNQQIVYSAVIGSEPTAMTRGTAKLEGGKVFVDLPQHFQYVTDMSTMTVVLTPHSADTYGLAVVKKKKAGFYVKELAGGTGNFTFDWEVKATRKDVGHQGVIREKKKVNKANAVVNVKTPNK